MVASLGGAMVLSILSEAHLENVSPRISPPDMTPVGEGSVLLAVQVDRPGSLHVVLEASDGAENFYKALPVDAGSYVGVVSFNGLDPHTAYAYRVWFESEWFEKTTASAVQNGTLPVPLPTVSAFPAAPHISGMSHPLRPPSHCIHGRLTSL